MANILLAGQLEKSRQFIEEYIGNNGFKEFEIEYYSEKIKIEDARAIKKTLSLKISGSKLFVLSGDFTEECQNALLKTLEESNENIHFIFCVEREDALLSTIHSRCKVVLLQQDQVVDDEVCILIEKISNANGIAWEEIDALAIHAKENGMATLLPALRRLMLSEIDNREKIHRYYNYTKKLFPQTTLSSINNINEKIVIETVFAS